MNTYICQFCKREYQSDGERKPKLFRKDGSIYQYYDSKLFCSKECCKKQTYEKVSKSVSKSLKQTYKEHPEIIERERIKHKQTIAKKTMEQKQISIQKMLNTRNNWSEEYKNEVRKKMSEKKLQMTEEQKRKRVCKFLLSYHKTRTTEPERWAERRTKVIKTFKDHPEIMKKRNEKTRQTLIDHPEIVKKRKEKYLQTFREKFKKEHPNYFELFKSYDDLLKYIENNNIKTKQGLSELLNINPCTLMSHLSRDFELDERFDSLLRNSISSYEEKIFQFLNKLDVRYELHKRQIIKPYEIDIYLPDYKIGIEFNGDWCHGEYFYWNDELTYNKEPNYHRMKSKLAEEKEIFLFHVFEHEWIEKKDILLSMIRNLLNKNKYKIPARRCEIKEVDSKTSNTFLNNNHLQGSDNSSIRYGLFYEDQLVSVMTFCKPRFNKKYNYELSRFCSLRGYTIVGGADKLFKHFIRNNPNKSIISYSNIAHTRGTVYEKLGFKLNSISNPNYVWYKYKRTEENKLLKDIYKRYEVQKHKLVKQGLDKYGNTENEIMSNLGYYRIFDCGNKVWAHLTAY